MLVSYISSDEVIVTSTRREKDMLKEYFGDLETGDMGRDLDDFDRQVCESQDIAVLITTRFQVE